MSEIKTNVIARDGHATVLTGPEYVHLNDESRAYLKTESLTAFVEYLQDGSDMNDVVVAYNNGQVCAKRKFVEHSSGVIATCTMVQSELLDLAVKLASVNMTPKMLEHALFRLRPYLDRAGVDLLDKVKNIRLQKVVNIERTKDDAGNFAYMVKREKGKEDIEWPPVVIVEVPLFSELEDSVAFRMRLIFDFDMDGEDVAMSFSFECPEIDDVIRTAKKAAIERVLSQLECPQYYGELVHEARTDVWKYHVIGTR